MTPSLLRQVPKPLSPYRGSKRLETRARTALCLVELLFVSLRGFSSCGHYPSEWQRPVGHHPHPKCLASPENDSVCVQVKIGRAESEISLWSLQPTTAGQVAEQNNVPFTLPLSPACSQSPGFLLIHRTLPGGWRRIVFEEKGGGQLNGAPS